MSTRNKEQRYFLAPSFTLATPLSDTEPDGARQRTARPVLTARSMPICRLTAHSFPNPNGRIPASTYTGEPGFDKIGSDQAMIGYEFRHRFDDAARIPPEPAGGVGRYRYVFNAQRRDTLARSRAAMSPAISRASCLPLTLRSASTPARCEFRRWQHGRTSRSTTSCKRISTPVGCVIRFWPGWTTRRPRSIPITAGPSSAFLIDVYNPVYGATPLPTKATMIPFINTTTNKDQLGIYLQDQIKLDRWNLVPDRTSRPRDGRNGQQDRQRKRPPG